MRKMYFLASAQVVSLSAFLVSGNKMAVASLVLSSTVTLGVNYPALKGGALGNRS